MAKTTYEVHPAIGIARLGSSPLSTEEGYFSGPEPGNSPPANYRDSGGFLRRQAARFRVFACRRDEAGRLLDASEITLDQVRSLTWTVHLANRKGVARRQYGSGPGFRNNAKCDDDRANRDLIIDPGPRSVGKPGERAVFDSGRFRKASVMLGEVVMEPEGRLRLLGGHGRSGSSPRQPRLTHENGHFADNDNWFDDTSDGPVVATVELTNKKVLECHAWAVVGPPDFVPGIPNLVTLYDVVFDLAVARGLLPDPTHSSVPLSFTRHIQPILSRVLSYRWVNRSANFGYRRDGRGHGPGGGADFSHGWAALADPSPAAKGRRAFIAGRLRNPDRKVSSPKMDPVKMMPRLNDGEWLGSNAANVLPLTTTQYRIMQAWASGSFINDLGGPSTADEPITGAFDRMALEACVGAALYPGIEVNPVIISHASYFMDGEPFRLSHEAVRPGGVTEYNAVPWQADFLVCRWEETEGLFPKRLGWWPAQRPDDVFTKVNATTMVPWARGLGQEYQDMVDKWDRLGFVVNKGTERAPFFVEAERDIGALGP